eukprot:scaffold157644_cov20-Tisochrysis_lutea.AAC.1
MEICDDCSSQGGAVPTVLLRCQPTGGCPSKAAWQLEEDSGPQAGLLAITLLCSPPTEVLL